MMSNKQFLFVFLTILVKLLIAPCNSEAAIKDYKTSEMKILVLIIACDHNSSYPATNANERVYPELQKLWRLYMNADPQHVESYFIKSDPKLKHEFEIHEDTIWWNGEETWIPGILNKTLIAMEAMYPRLHEFQYVIRTNLSSFYIFPRLLTFLETLPKKKCYCGVGIGHEHNCVQGAGIILSSDVVKLLVKNKHHLFDHPIIDDVALGHFLDSHKIHSIPAPRMDFNSRKEWEENKNNIPHEIFHIRARNAHGRRIPDEIYVQSELIKMFYGIDPFQR